MIKIIIELHPFGISENKEILGTVVIYNDGSGSKSIGNYHYDIYFGDKQEKWKQGSIKKFPRLKLNIWDLFFRILYDVVGVRNNKTNMEFGKE